MSTIAVNGSVARSTAALGEAVNGAERNEYRVADHEPLPTHPGLIRVHRGSDPTSYDTHATSLVDLPAGALFSPINGWTPAASPTYATVQTGPNSHLNLNSDLLYINHSCDPNLEFHVSKKHGIYEVRVAKDKNVKKGDKLTFFYPSTEWDMAQPFRCHCAESSCKGMIAGAKQMRESGALEGQWLNEHIQEMISN